MNKIIFAGIVFLIALSNLVLGQKADSLKVRLELNKIEFSQSDIVKLLIKNILNDTLYIYNPFYTARCIVLYKWSGQEWEEMSIQRYSGGIRMVPQKYLPGEEINFYWHQDYNIKMGRTSRERTSAPKGRYKFAFYFKPSLKYPGRQII